MAGRQGMRYLIDTSSVSAAIGAIDGADEVTREEGYLTDLMKAAHTDVADEFNMMITAHAAASRTLNHMFEWGTSGINTGRTTRRINPMSPEARLWLHTYTGTGKSGAVGFTFLPSHVPVPKPTTTRTGIDQKYLSKLKGKHIFWNKAFVMESGTTVTIRPAPGKKLFIPHMGRSPSNIKASDLAKGFTMYPRSVELTPGQNSAGTFTAYFKQFWETKGQKSMEANVFKTFNTDLTKALRKASASRGAPLPPNPARVHAQVKASSAKTSKSMRNSAKARRVTG